jgi:glyoxylase-like metal-dependent hydrolase (beta-lactamase superfamily II)
MTVPFKKAVEDPAAFAASVNRMLAWDFDRVIVGHGEPIETGGKEKVRAAIRAAGFEAVA